MALYFQEPVKQTFLSQHRLDGGEERDKRTYSCELRSFDL